MSIVRFGPLSSAQEAREAGKDTCPIGLDALADPVYRIGRQYYNAPALAQWVANPQHRTDPMTRAAITPEEIEEIRAYAPPLGAEMEEESDDDSEDHRFDTVESVLETMQTDDTITLYSSDFDSEGMCAIFRGLRRNTVVAHLECSDIYLSDESIRELCGALSENITLDHLVITGVHMSQGAMNMLAAMIRTNTNLHTFDISGNRNIDAILAAIEHNQTIEHFRCAVCHFGYEGARSVAQMLRANTHIDTIDVYGNGIPIRGISRILDAVRVHHEMKKITLGTNDVGDSGAFKIASILRDHPRLEEIGVTRANIGPRGIIDIMNSIRGSVIFKSIDLADNDIIDDTVAHIANALRVNRSVETIALSSNAIGDAGAISIAEVIRTNPIIKYIHLNLNRIGPIGAAAIISAMAMNITVESVNLWGNNMEGVVTTDDRIRLAVY